MTKKHYTLDAFQKVATKMAQNITPSTNATVLALHGDLGAGKTTFVQAFAKALGVRESVNSPTFVMQKQYTLEGQKFSKLIHIDAYRLENARELEVLDWRQQLCDPGNLIVIEWAERVADVLPSDAQHMRFTYIDDDTRSVMTT